MTVKIDVDGVIRDIITAMCRIYNNKFGGKLCPDDIDDYDINTNFAEIPKRTGMTPVDYFFRENAGLIFEYFRTMGIRLLLLHGSSIWII